MKKKSLTSLQNIGKTLAQKLNNIDIRSETDLKRIGSVKAYKWLQNKEPTKKLPLCYYLYSLEGAILNKDWRELTEGEKEQLRTQSGLQL